MIPQKAIKKFTKAAHREIVVGHLLAYGFFPQTSEGIDQAKKFVDGLDSWVAPSNLPNYYDGIESDLMTGRETAGIVNIRMLLEEFYFKGGNVEEEEEETILDNVPVTYTVEEYEGEPESGDPIEIVARVPFRSKKRIRLPRRKGVIYKGYRKPVSEQEKKDTAERMADAFDRNLDDLLDSIVNDEEETGETPKERAAVIKKTLVRRRKSVNITVGETGQGDSLADYIGSKIGKSFKMAAQARRADKGLKKKPMFYLGKALSNQFGGDLINRTKGTFSQNPTDTQDPALTRSQRFTASVQPYMNEQGPVEPPGTGDNRNDIVRAFDMLRGKFDELIKLKKNKNEQGELAYEIQQTTVEEATKVIEENNKVKKDAIQLELQLQDLNADESDRVQAAEIEKIAEETNLQTGISKVDNRRDDGIDDEPTESDGDGEDGPGFLDFLDVGLDLLDGGNWLGRGASVGRRGASRVVRRTALRLGGKRLAKSAVTRGAQAVVTRAATALSGKAVIGFLRPIFKRIPIVGGLIDFVVSLAMGEPVGRAAAKAIGATLGGALGSLIPIPGVGTIAGGIVGDLVGGAIYDAVTGGAPPEPTGATKEEAEAAGAPTSYADQSGGLGSPDPVPEEPPEKLASGGFLAGEAGPEYKFDLSSDTGKKVVKTLASVDNSTLSAAPFILGITQQILDRLGSDVAPIRSWVSQELGPLEKLYGASNFNISTSLQDSPKNQEATEKKSTKGMDLSLDGKGGKGKGDAGGGGAQPAETMTGGPVTPVNVPGSVKERAKAALQFYLSKGFSDSGAAYMVGNLMQESMLDPAANGDNGKAWGLAQWREDAASGARWIKYKEWAAANNKQPGDFYAQLEYTIVEGNQYNAGLTKMKGNDIEEHKRFIKAYEGYSEEGNRFGFGQDILNNINEYKGASQSTPSTPPTSAPAPNADDEEQVGPDPASMAEPPAATPSTRRRRTQGSTAGVARLRAQQAQQQVGPDPNAMAPIPSNLLAAAGNGVTIQPIIISGSNQAIGYAMNVSDGEMGVQTLYYDKSGRNRTTLENLKQARLQGS